NRMAGYRSVIEIGANVGVFTVFFSDWLKRLQPGGKVFAFEPSPRAYQRLLENIKANDCGNVVAVNCAVGGSTGFFPFFEPEDHLTNGSLDAQFAGQFSSVLNATPVLVVAGDLLETLPGLEEPILLKIDAEGAEAQILRSLEGFIRSH